jgi:hypothetical protein
MGEHSPVDALVPSIVCEYAVAEGIDASMFEGDVDCSHVDGGVGRVGGTGWGWERLDWVVDERIGRECQRAEEGARALVADSDDGGLWFTDYGADWIKDVGTFVLIPSLSFVHQLTLHTQRNTPRTPTSRWPSNSHGTDPVANSRRRTKQP